MAWVNYYNKTQEKLPHVKGNYYELEDGTWCLSYGGWLPGYYDKLETARKAVYLPEQVLKELADSVCNINGENRPITLEDLKKKKENE